MKINAKKARSLTAALRKKRARKGGSNSGRYKGVKSFAGPAGGAPGGTFPINTRKRAKAALAYARNAPNPGGIKKAVAKKYPGLGKGASKKARSKVKGLKKA